MKKTTKIVVVIVVVIVIVYVVWSVYWRVQFSFNSAMLSVYTPEDIFPVSTETQKTLDDLEALGRQTAKKSSVVVCGTLRDAASQLDSIIKRVTSVTAMFENYLVLIVENDSVDDTRKRLLRWANNDPKVKILGCGVNAPSCKMPKAKAKTEGHSVDAARIEKMVHIRNVYMDYIHSNNVHADYILVWDLDIIGSLYTDGVANTISWMHFNRNIQAVCAYGVYRWMYTTLYYDTYAHVDLDDKKFDLSKKHLDDIKKGLKVRYSRGDPLVKVVSCFGGATVYRGDSIFGKRYFLSDNIECEHTSLCRQLNGVYVNPSMIHYVLYNK